VAVVVVVVQLQLQAIHQAVQAVQVLLLLDTQALKKHQVEIL